MEEYLPVLKQTILFSDVTDDEILSMIRCLGVKKKTYPAENYVFTAGETIEELTVLVRGALLVQRDDYWGNRSIINRILPGELFGEAYAIPGNGPMFHDVLATEDSTVLFFDVNKVMTVCSGTCPFHTRVIGNLLRALASKNRDLTRKIDHLAKRSTREKLIAYLSAESRKQNTPSFDIPFDRQQLADYLAVDRSAMSRELCRMKEEGMLRFRRSHFELLGKNQTNIT
ncbi:MAG: Crp/Fnr family transcriptional regulator [Clostridia bacterium]|nr:Crp/Fnr family transcriptional regulator [Clostridia bacterium]